ncbi:alpha/beta fold hydrolase [Jatrophihabitans fulvus]
MTALATEHWGTDDPSAPRALLVHGITSSAATMWQLGEGLAAQGWSVTAADLPGHGRTGAWPSYRITDSAEALAELGTHWDLYVGHSLGGAIGTLLLAGHPGLVDRAVLIDPALRVPDERLEVMAEEFVGNLRTTVEQVTSEHPHWHPRTIELRVQASAQAVPDAIRATAVDSRPWDVLDAAVTVTTPVHVLVASDGSTVWPGQLEAIAASNPRWTWEVVPDTTHSVHRDRPDVVLDRLLERA